MTRPTIWKVKMKLHLSLWMKFFKLIFFFFSTFIMGQHKSVKSLTCEQLKTFSNTILFLWEFYSIDPPLAAPHSPPKFHIQSNSTKLCEPKLPASVPWSHCVEVSCLRWVFLGEMLLGVFVVSCQASYVGFLWVQCLLSVYAICGLPWEPTRIPESSYCTTSENLFKSNFYLFL